MTINVLHIFFILLINSILADESVLCTSSYCDAVKCNDLSIKCQVQNSTHNGIVLPSPQTCNCCEYCLDNLNEGDECSTGDPSSPSHTSLCGPGLYCELRQNSDYDGYCKRMNTTCHQMQNDYDNRRQNGLLGSMEVRQACDDEGLFSSYKCIPGQTCYCVSKNGTRIFGEADFTGLPSFQMQCGCSRDYQKAVDIIGRDLVPSEHFRCAPKGDYDSLQCIAEQCLCVDTADGAPTYPDESLVNMTLVSNETLKCYSEDQGGIYRKCEEEYIVILDEVKTYEEEGYDMVFSYNFPKCDIDGSYQAVQENFTHKICVDKEGEVLTAIDKIENATLAEAMNCKCLRAISVMSSIETPTCEINGNYSPTQCRRGICRCVDDNGNQVCSSSNCEVNEDNKDSLIC